MPVTCLGYSGYLPSLKVIASCSRDAVEAMAGQANNAEAVVSAFGYSNVMIIAGASIVGTIIILRFLALVGGIGRATQSARKSGGRQVRKSGLERLPQRRPKDG